MISVHSHPGIQLPLPLTHGLRTMGTTGQTSVGSAKFLTPLRPFESHSTGSLGSMHGTELRPNAFAELLLEGVDSVNQSQHHADGQIHELLTGGDVTQAEVLTSVQKADMAFRLLVQVRNKLMAAYEELNSIRV